MKVRERDLKRYIIPNSAFSEYGVGQDWWLGMTIVQIYIKNLWFTRNSVQLQLSFTLDECPDPWSGTLQKIASL